MTNPPPTEQDIQGYVHTYKNNLLEKNNTQMNEAFEQGNRIDTTISLQLLLIASVLLTIIAGVITTSDDPDLNDGAKVLVTASIVFLLASILCCLIDLSVKALFFEKWGKHLHQQGRIINDDNSKTTEELDSLRTRLQQNADKMPGQSSNLPRTLSVTFFLLGLACIFILVIAKIYS